MKHRRLEVDQSIIPYHKKSLHAYNKEKCTYIKKEFETNMKELLEILCHYNFI